MSLKDQMETLLPAIEAELQRVVAQLDRPRMRPYYEMLAYHMGWTGEGAGPEAQGKRIRPLLVLLTTSACGSDWRTALPAAAAVELIHNFSLVHDDIQDTSDLRRGRPTVWKKWNMPQAINTGDGLFVLANLAATELLAHHPAETVLRAARILHETCLDLTRGQFLDMSYETRTDLTVEDYWPMIAAKTAALLSGCCQVGALLGGADESAQESYRSFGNYLGLAFQVQDDFLGIWGDSALTGKSTDSDLVSGKKSFPVLVGLGRGGPFARRWAEGPIRPEETAALAEGLAEEGVKMHTQETADQMNDLAIASLRTADPQGEAGEALFELAQKLIDRKT
ncbi:MAG: polyprenyl synthetase family protein [Anaerolineales bacterium]|nr:polyprenyl synthetase family protein [Anaerolineales bacterium]